MLYTLNAAPAAPASNAAARLHLYYSTTNPLLKLPLDLPATAEALPAACAAYWIFCCLLHCLLTVPASLLLLHHPPAAAMTQRLRVRCQSRHALVGGSAALQQPAPQQRHPAG
jgi:hypothetical protein